MIATRESQTKRARFSGGAPARVLAWAAPIAGVVVLYLLMFGRPVIRSDEAWFTWVIERVRHGDVLYRDVYYVSTPLGAWLGTIASLVGGTTILTMRALSVGIFVASAVLVWWTARYAALRVGGCLVLLAALFAYASPVAQFSSIYSSFAILCALITFAAAFVWFDAPRGVRGSRALTIAGIAAGLCIAAKPNTGFLTLLALLATVFIRERDARVVRADVRRVLVPAGLVVTTMMLVVAATGGFAAFVGDVILEKNDYVRVMSRSPIPGFGRVFQILPGHGPQAVRVLASGRRVLTSSASLGTRYFETFRLVPFVAAGVVAWAYARTRRVHDNRVVVCATFLVAGWASAFPQPGPQHLTEVAPLVLAAAGAAVGTALRIERTARPSGTTRVFVVGAVVLWLAFGVATITARAVDGLPGGAIRASSLRHMDGTPIRARDERTIRRDTTALRSATGGNVFIVRADAAFYYLAGALHNPTPYDFAARSDFGREGEEGVIDLLSRHRVRFACVASSGYRPRAGPDLEPHAVARAVRERFHYVARLSICTLYEDPVFAEKAARSARVTRARSISRD